MQLLNGAKPYLEVIGQGITNETTELFSLFTDFKLKGYRNDGFLYIEVSGKRSDHYFNIGTVGFPSLALEKVLEAKIIIVDAGSSFDFFVKIKIDDEDKTLIIPEEKVGEIENFRKEEPRVTFKKIPKWTIRKWKIQAFFKKIRKKLKL